MTMAGISESMGYTDLTRSPRQGPGGNRLGGSSTVAAPHLTPDQPIGVQQKNDQQQRLPHFHTGMGEARPGATIPEAAGGEAAAGGAAAAGAGEAAAGAAGIGEVAAELAPLALL
jgi:hypothetical protein